MPIRKMITEAKLMTTTTAEKDLTSIGVLAARMQRSVRQIEQAIEVLGLTAPLRLNGVMYFDGDQAALIQQFLRQ